MSQHEIPITAVQIFGSVRGGARCAYISPGEPRPRTARVWESLRDVDENLIYFFSAAIAALLI